MTSWSFEEDDDNWVFKLENDHVETEILFRGGGYKIQDRYQLDEAKNRSRLRTQIDLRESNTLYVSTFQNGPIDTLNIKMDQASADALRAYMDSIPGRPDVGNQVVANVLTAHEYVSPESNNNSNNSNNGNNGNNDNNSNNNNSNSNNNSNNNNDPSNATGTNNNVPNTMRNEPINYKGGYKRRESRCKRTYRKQSKSTRRR